MLVSVGPTLLRAWPMRRTSQPRDGSVLFASEAPRMLFSPALRPLRTKGGAQQRCQPNQKGVHSRDVSAAGLANCMTKIY